MSNLLILGDSFCEHAQYWPTWTSELLGYNKDQLHVNGQPGAGWWPLRGHLQYLIKSKKEFMANLSQAIIVHPSPARIITDNALILTNNAVVLPMKYDNTQFDEAQLASSLYYKYINNREFHNWAEQNWFKELNDMLKSTSVLHLFATESSFRNAEVLNGQRILTPLTDLSLQVNPKRTSIGTDFKLPNHFSLAHNRVLAQQIAGIIQGQRKDFDAQAFAQ